MDSIRTILKKPKKTIDIRPLIKEVNKLKEDYAINGVKTS